MSNFRQQYNRMVRWRNRIKEDAQPEPEAAFDVFFAFAQACYHLVDWLEHDHSPIRRAEADRLVNESDVLSFCRDICNGSKHAILEAKRVRLSTRTTPEVGWKFEHSKDGEETEGSPSRVYYYEVVFAWHGSQVSALEFADRCIKEWVRILRTRDLVPRRWDAQRA